jgi:hypothetical protein
VERDLAGARVVSAREERTTGQPPAKPGATRKRARASAPRAARATPAARTGATRRLARNEVSPSPGLDDPWADLHPARIWPD